MGDEISSKDVRHVANLARLTIRDEQVGKLADELGAVLSHFQSLSRVDVKEAEPMAHPMDRTNCMRSDEPKSCLDPDQVLAAAPHTQGPFIDVPKVVDGGEM